MKLQVMSDTSSVEVFCDSYSIDPITRELQCWDRVSLDRKGRKMKAIFNRWSYIQFFSEISD